MLLKNLPPGPWHVTQNTSGFAYVCDATGRKIATILGKQNEKAAIADLLVWARRQVVKRSTAAPDPAANSEEVRK